MESNRNISISIPSVGDEEWHAIKKSIDSGWLTQGPRVKEFEQGFASRHEVKHALATTSCTTALHLMLLSIGIGPGDEVIVPSFTWISTANAVLYCGAKPVLCDVDPVTYNISLNSIIEKITSKTKAILVVHLFGLCVDVEEIKKVVPPSISIVEDCACAAGASLRGVPAGKLGRAGAFSFHPRKSITTGEGGMLTTDEDSIATLAEQLRNHGAKTSEEVRHQGAKPFLLPTFEVLGFNYRMTDLQGAIGFVQLQKLDKFIAERQELALYYMDALSDIPWIQMPQVPLDGQHAWQSFVTRIIPSEAPMGRDLIMEKLQGRGVASRPGTHAIHMLDYYRTTFGYSDEDLPGAKYCHENTLSLPLHNKLTMSDIDFIADSLLKLF
jgi:dTDP-4-amino-4,6-dideoxygalactose transaminase